MTREIKSKISLFCSLPPECVITALDVENIYDVPLVLHGEGLDDKIVELLGIWTKAPDLRAWQDLAERIRNPRGEVTIGIVGKYVHLTDSYKSLNEALHHGGIANGVDVKLRFVDAESLDGGDGTKKALEDVDGILVPGGFGERGVDGKLRAIRYAREEKIPFYGICLGMQLAVVDFARHVCGLTKANSLEFDANTPDPVISLMEEQKAVHNKGATMRLGSYPCTLEKNTKAFAAYGERQIEERHRHRYEFNNQFTELFTQHGLRVAGVSETAGLVEIVELADHPWFLGCQFHPEFKSRPMSPHPLFAHFIQAALAQSKRRRWTEQKTTLSSDPLPAKKAANSVKSGNS